jgi:hypothetical protein
MTTTYHLVWSYKDDTAICGAKVGAPRDGAWARTTLQDLRAIRGAKDTITRYDTCSACLDHEDYPLMCLALVGDQPVREREYRFEQVGKLVDQGLISMDQAIELVRL